MKQNGRAQIENAINKFAIIRFKSFLIKVFNTISPNTKFIDNWHIDLIEQYLKQIEECKMQRLIINIPPRSLKSTIISVAWPAWLLGQDPTKRIIVASYSQALSQKHSQECRLIMASEWYQALFPKTKIRKGSDTKAKFLTTKQGFRFATSISGTLTGEGADILIVDDPHTPLQASSDSERERAINWFDGTFATRLNNKKRGAIVVVMQRLHQKDLSGHLIKKSSDDIKIWEHLKLESISTKDQIYKCGSFSYKRAQGDLLCKEREDKTDISRTKAELGSYAFNAQYQQEPSALEGGLIKYEWIKRYDARSVDFHAIYQSWDCASKVGRHNDYSVCTTWGVMGSKCYLIDVIRKKLEFHELKSAAKSVAEEYNPIALLIEDASAGQALIQELKNCDMLTPVIPIKPQKDKVTRLLASISFFEAGNIHFVRAAQWLAECEQELFAFPNVEHDDQVDSIVQFINYIKASHTNRVNIKGL
ncbi:MAG: phage terminase large subunit [Candidatus Jidaibacter sp.]|jgi:predicted phage terminase large subunit-like protein|nr:phage terminase large subunit [Candidatus Jidaibacter sp.]